MATRTWDGGGSTNNWSEAANWSGDAAPVAGDDVVFDATSSKACTVNTLAISIRSFDSTAYTGTITINTGVTITTVGKFLWGATTNNIVCNQPSAATVNVGGDFGAPVNSNNSLGGI